MAQERDSLDRRHNPSFRDYGACYALVLVIMALAYVTFLVWTQALLLLVGVAIDTIWVRPGVYGFGILFVGFALFILLMIAEPYLRGGVHRGSLGRRFRRLAAILGGFLVLGLVAEEVLFLMLRSAS